MPELEPLAEPTGLAAVEDEVAHRWGVLDLLNRLSHLSRYSVSPRAQVSIVRGARLRSLHTCNHPAACSCLPSTGHSSWRTGAARTPCFTTARTGALTGPDKEHAETSMLALHLLQSALVHVDALLHVSPAGRCCPL
ncbi:hypothetical protein [Streptomyces qinglanensis]|uniref:hypothetical protein n=1 Tax=Streptomyces qinglanensis TaxID=943816 RepID=UPI0037B088CB